ncbi:MAG: hypothetical protein V4755_07225 [Curtobacterium sp.]
MPHTEPAGTCRACALVGWLRVLSLVSLGARSRARAEAREVTFDQDDGHHLRTHVIDGWKVAPAVFPPIDRHDWAGTFTMTPRSVYRALARMPRDRRSPLGPVSKVTPLADSGDVSKGLSRAEDAAVELAARIDDLFAALHEMTAELDQHRRT